jgi:hypothetical protein
MSRVRVQLTGTIPQTDIDQIRVYFIDKNDAFARGGGSQLDAVSGGPYDFQLLTTVDIALDPNVVDFDASGQNRLYVAFDFKPTADLTSTVGCEILEVEWGAQGVGTGTSDPPPGVPHGTTQPVDDYLVTLNASGAAPSPAEGEQGGETVPILKLEFVPTLDTITADIDSIQLHRIGSGSDSDIAPAGVILYDDSGSVADSFDSGDTEIAGSAGTLVGGSVTLNPTANLVIPPGGATFFVTMNIAVTASFGETIGLDVENPSTDITFIDVTDDTAVSSVAYVQQGYITSTTTTPTSNNTVTITLLQLDIPIPDEPVAANNRILPGQTNPVVIYIPEPPGGPSERVTVQIYTVAGERVATLVDNRRYSQISSSLPLLWFGKNQRQKDLGPGLYFIQIKTSSYTKILKVLIVR